MAVGLQRRAATRKALVRELSRDTGDYFFEQSLLLETYSWLMQTRRSALERAHQLRWGIAAALADSALCASACHAKTRRYLGALAKARVRRELRMLCRR